MVNKESEITFLLKDRNLHIYIRHAKFIKVYAVVEKLTLVKPFVMLKNVGQSIILLIISQNQPNILLITKNTPFCGAFYSLLQKMVEHVKT